MAKRVLLAGESWMSYTTHVKGFDTFYTSVYETGEKYIKKAFEEGGYEFTFLPNHLAMEEFPFSLEELKKYDLVFCDRRYKLSTNYGLNKCLKVFLSELGIGSQTMIATAGRHIYGSYLLSKGLIYGLFQDY